MKMKRRSFFTAGLLGAGVTAYSLHRGLRLPPLIWEPHALPSKFQKLGLTFMSSELITTATPVVETLTDLNLRAFTPEPALIISAKDNSDITIAINNISPKAELITNSLNAAKIEEEIDGINRILKINMLAGSQLELRFSIDVTQGYTFTAIGDTGGQQELKWCLQRAHDLEALFFLHLGDFYYTEGDYQRAISHFNNSPIPSYVAIGNHDFHDGKTVYQNFLNDIGPFNSSFTLGNARFANVDTASNLIPWNGGQRAVLLNQLKSETAATSNIAFTHRPLFDPIENSSHDIGNSGERDWLIKALLEAEFQTLISGHIHIHARERIQGIDNIIVGQGLGHQDLITDQDYSKMALGKVAPNGEVSIGFAPLSMPWELHCHPRNDIVKESLSDSPHAQKITDLKKHCG